MWIGISLKSITDNQQTYEKMLSITYHQGNTNWKHNEIPPNSFQNGYQKINKQVLARMWRKEKSCALLVELYINASTIENSMEITQKNLKRTTIWPSNPTFGYLSKENKNTNSKRYMHPYALCSIIYNSQEDVEATKVSIDRWMDKEDVVNIYNGMLLSNKREWNLAICNKKNGSRGYYTKWYVSEKDKHYVITLMRRI